MLAEERFEEILKIVNRQRTVTVQELTEMLNTSESTIRRDLTELDKQSLLNKVHGGAISKDISYMTQDPNLDYRHELYKEEKVTIAKYCARLIDENDFVYLDAGTTTELIIDYLETKSAIFVTNAMNHARKLAAMGHKVYILSGEIKAATEAVIGSETIECLEKYNFTKGFFGTNGISMQSGFTTPEIGEAMVKKKALSKCREKYMIADASKFNQISSVSFWRFEDAVIITDTVNDKSYKTCKNITEVSKL